VAGFVLVSGREDGGEEVLVALFSDRGGLGGPDRVQDGEVVGVGEGLLPGLGGRQLLAVPAQDLGQDACRVLGCGGGCRDEMASLGVKAVVAGEFGGRAGARGGVGDLG